MAGKVSFRVSAAKHHTSRLCCGIFFRCVVVNFALRRARLFYCFIIVHWILWIVIFCAKMSARLRSAAESTAKTSEGKASGKCLWWVAFSIPFCACHSSGTCCRMHFDARHQHQSQTQQRTVIRCEKMAKCVFACCFSLRFLSESAQSGCYAS